MGASNRAGLVVDRSFGSMASSCRVFTLGSVLCARCTSGGELSSHTLSATRCKSRLQKVGGEGSLGVFTYEL